MDHAVHRAEVRPDQHRRGDAVLGGGQELDPQQRSEGQIDPTQALEVGHGRWKVSKTSSPNSATAIRSKRDVAASLSMPKPVIAGTPSPPIRRDERNQAI